jgi:hypothetical protein
MDVKFMAWLRFRQDPLLSEMQCYRKLIGCQKLKAQIADLIVQRLDGLQYEFKNPPFTDAWNGWEAYLPPEARQVGWSLGTLSRLTDWMPSVALRKVQKKLVADDQVEIAEFIAQHRRGLAKWRTFCTWSAWAWYLARAPFNALVNWLVQRLPAARPPI